MAISHMRGVVFVIMVFGSVAIAETYKERNQGELDRALARTNEACGGTTITLAPIDWTAWEKVGGKAQDCAPIISTVANMCSNDSGKPHVAGQAFVKEKVKSLACGMIPDKGKPEEKVTAQNGVITFTRVPQYSPTGEVPRLLYADPVFAKVFDIKREWDIVNIDTPEAAKNLVKHCGDDMKLTIDIASWRVAGNGQLPNALDVGEMCRIYAGGLATVCESEKAAARKKFDSFRCSYSKAIKGKAKVSFKGREVVVESSPTIGFGDGELVREAVMKKLGKKAK